MDTFFCPPALTTAAIFVAILSLDLFKGDYKLMPAHSILGFVAVILMGLLCQRGAGLSAWILLLVPFVLLFLGWTVWALKWEARASAAAQKAAAMPAAAQYKKQEGAPYCQCNGVARYRSSCCVNPDALKSA